MYKGVIVSKETVVLCWWDVHGNECLVYKQSFRRFILATIKCQALKPIYGG